MCRMGEIGIRLDGCRRFVKFLSYSLRVCLSNQIVGCFARLNCFERVYRRKSLRVLSCAGPPLRTRGLFRLSEVKSYAA